MKVCSKCKIEKEIDNFSKSGKYYNSWCRLCRSELEQNRRIKNGIVPKIKPKIIGEEHKECLKCKKILHINLFNISSRGRLNRNPYCKICESAYHKELKNKDIEKYRKLNRERTQKHRDLNREEYRGKKRIEEFNRKNKIKAVSDGTVTKEFMIKLYNTEICFWCEKFIEKDKRTAEHVIPLSRGGTHSADNLKMACLSCNCSKLNCK